MPQVFNRSDRKLGSSAISACPRLFGHSPDTHPGVLTTMTLEAALLMGAAGAKSLWEVHSALVVLWNWSLLELVV